MLVGRQGNSCSYCRGDTYSSNSRSGISPSNILSRARTRRVIASCCQAISLSRSLWTLGVEAKWRHGLECVLLGGIGLVGKVLMVVASQNASGGSVPFASQVLLLCIEVPSMPRHCSCLLKYFYYVFSPVKLSCRG